MSQVTGQQVRCDVYIFLLLSDPIGCTSDISLAASYGLDGFFLNMGADSWQPARISDAFAAAEAYNAKHPTTNGSAPAFRLALSLDMSSFSCANSADVSNLRTIATSHSSSSAYLKICTSTTSSALPVLSTFSGQYCGFGQAGWKSVSSGFWFAPAFFDMSTGWTGWSGVQASVNVGVDSFLCSMSLRP